MPVDKSDAQRAREVQERTVYKRICSICVREFYDSLVGACPERGGRQVCMYCCQMCEHHYTMSGQIGQRCRMKDAARRKPAVKKTSPPAAGGTSPEGEAEKERTA